MPTEFDARDASPAKVTQNDTATFVTPPTEPIPAEMLMPPLEPYTLGPGDVLDIEVLGEKDTRAETFVTPDGKVYYSLLKGLPVTGRTLNEVRQTLEKELSAYYRQPRISLSLQEVKSKRVWVLGRLNAPGIYPLAKPMRVLEAISMAGGLFTSAFTGTTEELADLKHSFIMRDGKMLPVDMQKLIRDGDMNQNIYLRDRDYLYLPSSLSNEVYVLGGVNEPRPVGFMDEMNIMTAIGRALGLKENADPEHVTIVRGSLARPEVAVVNLHDILRGEATNVRLQPGDIVQVPIKGAFSWQSLGAMAVDSFVTSVALSEGRRVIGSSSGTQLSVGLDGKPTASLSNPTTNP